MIDLQLQCSHRVRITVALYREFGCTFRPFGIDIGHHDSSEDRGRDSHAAQLIDQPAPLVRGWSCCRVTCHRVLGSWLSWAQRLKMAAPPCWIGVPCVGLFTGHCEKYGRREKSDVECERSLPEAIVIHGTQDRGPLK